VARLYYQINLELSGNSADACLHLGETLIEQGKIPLGMKWINRGIDDSPEKISGSWFWNRVRALPDETDWQPELGKVDHLLQTSNKSYSDETHLLFCRAFALDQLEQTKESFVQYRAANARKRRPSNANPTEVFEQYLTTSLSEGNADLADGPPVSGLSRPIFIVGMPRSGTTLVERLLVQSTGVFTAGELFDIKVMVDNSSDLTLPQQYRRSFFFLSEGAEAVVDKMPTNFLFLRQITNWSPDALIIHCQRDDRAVRWSCFTSNLGWPFADLESCQEYQVAYHEQMGNYLCDPSVQMLELEYEKTVANPEATIQLLIEFLEHHRVSIRPQELLKFATRTPNKFSVHSPVHTRSVDRWKKYLDL